MNSERGYHFRLRHRGLARWRMSLVVCFDVKFSNWNRFLIPAFHNILDVELIWQRELPLLNLQSRLNHYVRRSQVRLIPSHFVVNCKLTCRPLATNSSTKSDAARIF
ncbi:hypothetical protein LSAT2_008055 [Lamellibrachia satsuma]|nr:hypothetical protein LSAT2_008055 [Lamellibrachia satsuma]